MRRPDRRRAPRDLVASETRAEVARRRLAQLAASFEQGVAPGDLDDDAEPDEPDEPAPRRSRLPAGAHARSVDGPALVSRPPLRGVHGRVVAAVAVAAAVVLTWWVLAERPRSADVAPVAVPAARSSAPPSPGAGPDGRLVVDVAGKVRRPGIVTLPAGSRVHEAITAAGGLKGRIDTSSLNLARRLTDGEQVLVGVAPATGPGPTGGGPGAGGAGAGGTGQRVDLNSATLAQLDALPGVGPVTAQAILDWRTEHGRFTRVEDLLEVRGIGDKTLADLRDLVVV